MTYVPGIVSAAAHHFIVGIALLVFGPSKFKDLGKGLGEGIKNFKSSVKEDEAKDADKKP